MLLIYSDYILPDTWKCQGPESTNKPHLGPHLLSCWEGWAGYLLKLSPDPLIFFRLCWNPLSSALCFCLCLALTGVFEGFIGVTGLSWLLLGSCSLFVTPWKLVSVLLALSPGIWDLVAIAYRQKVPSQLEGENDGQKLWSFSGKNRL